MERKKEEKKIEMGNIGDSQWKQWEATGHTDPRENNKKRKKK